MKRDQKNTPKYWVIHDTETDDILSNTMSKSVAETCKLMQYWHNTDWEDNQKYEMILVEVKPIYSYTLNEHYTITPKDIIKL